MRIGIIGLQGSGKTTVFETLEKEAGQKIKYSTYGDEKLKPHLGTIPVRCPPNDCQNIAFSGPEKQTLYIAGAGSLYKVATIARGFTGRAK